jgi:hypothetical protein
MTKIGGIGYHGSYVGKRAETGVLDDVMPQELFEHIEPPKKVKVATGCPLCDVIWSSAMAYENQYFDKVAIVMNYDEPWLYVPSVSGDDPWHSKTVMRVKFCPKCGRKLVEE